ncbi:methyl-accepting chemotaxis protein [Castellaniella sp. GW247-6E4]|uniref:methyl-accepting chemotaxis protein n=1 Tax=Castellaniella sp. GW247-6E4 TaxID=3140380 RepID=UPI00331610D9
MQIGKKVLFGALKVRTSLILVLTFFFVMLVAGAALGVLSLRFNNDALKSIVRDQHTASSMDAAINQYQDVQVMMGRTMASFTVNSDLLNNSIVSSWSGDEQASGLSDASQALLKEAERQIARSREAFSVFKTQAEATMAPESGYDRVINAYDELTSSGLTKLLDALKSGQMETYNDVLTNLVVPMEANLQQSYETLKEYQRLHIAEAVTREETLFERVVAIVGVSMLVALLFAFSAYVFLQRVVLRPLANAGAHFDGIAAGDLTRPIAATARNEIGVLYEAMRRMQDGLSRTVASVRGGVGEIRNGSQEIFAGNTDLSSRTEQQAASLQQTAASMEELASTVRQNSDNAEQADRLAKSAAEVAQRGGAAVAVVAETMTGITASSGKMSEIVSVIDGIAFQTNILALNAAVEAARAGEQGKGFAVVAGEVRSLAQRSAQAAKEIKGLIDESIGRVKEGSERVGDAARIMDEIVKSVQGVTAIMHEISSASREQSDGIVQINQAVTEMDGVVQRNAALVQQAAAAAGSLQEQAERLAEAVSVFKIREGGEVIDVSGGALGYRSQPVLPTLALNT